MIRLPSLFGKWSRAGSERPDTPGGALPADRSPASGAAAIDRLGMRVALEGLRDRGYAPETVFDIGASDGSWTEMALSVWPVARYYCFEPLSERRAALERLGRSHRGRIEPVFLGIGDEDTELSLGVTDGLWDSSFAYEGSVARRVAVRRLDTLLKEGRIPPADFVKIDVQGFERRVIRGGEQALFRVAFVLMECNFFAFCGDMVTLDETIGFMAARGFIPYEFVDFLRRPLDGAMGQCDILFVRRGHPLVSDRRWSGP
ncbi:MAG TPA: FkbM family methyltransferase [Anaeromyxobacter sp.]|nr:FkbM family methyltransferase [Anaeromyxobacter sp.]